MKSSQQPTPGLFTRCKNYFNSFFFFNNPIENLASISNNNVHSVLNMQQADALLTMAKQYRDGTKQYRDGTDGITRDVVKAIDYFDHAIMLGSSDAKLELGITYLQGKGCISEDLTKGIELLTPLANEGNKEAAYLLGSLFLVGDNENNIRSDQEKACQYLTVVAKSDNPHSLKASEKLGAAYTDGKFGFPQSNENAKFYWELAEKLGNKDAREILRISFRMH